MVNILKQIINHSNHPWEVCTGIAVGPESVLIGSAEASSSNALFPMCLGSSRGTALTIECNYQGRFWGQVLMLWMEHFTADRSILHVVGGAGKISYTSFPLRKFYAYLQIGKALPDGETPSCTCSLTFLIANHSGSLAFTFTTATLLTLLATIRALLVVGMVIRFA